MSLYEKFKNIFSGFSKSKNDGDPSISSGSQPFKSLRADFLARGLEQQYADQIFTSENSLHIMTKNRSSKFNFILNPNNLSENSLVALAQIINATGAEVLYVGSDFHLGNKVLKKLIIERKIRVNTLNSNSLSEHEERALYLTSEPLNINKFPLVHLMDDGTICQTGEYYFISHDQAHNLPVLLNRIFKVNAFCLGFARNSSIFAGRPTIRVKKIKKNQTNEMGAASVERLKNKSFNYNDLSGVLKQFKDLKKNPIMMKAVAYAGFKITPEMERAINIYASIIASMTQKERLNPKLIEMDESRRLRIERGSKQNRILVRQLMDILRTINEKGLEALSIGGGLGMLGNLVGK